MTSLISLFSPISHGYSRNCITHQLEKVFLKVIFCFFFRSVFISIYGFRQTFWLNFIILWTFFKTNPWFNAYCKFLMCITYSVLSCKLATSFSTFSTFKSNQIKQFIVLHDFYKFWYTLTKIKWLNIFNGKSCVGRRLVRKPYISEDHIMGR